MASFSKYKTQKGTFWRFQLFYTDPTTKKRKRVGQGQFLTKTQAKLAAELFEKKIQQSYKKNEKYPFKKIYELWFENYKLTTKESTWTTTKRNFENHILPIFKDIDIPEIRTLDCQNAVNFWFKKPLHNYKRFFNGLRTVLEYAVRMEIIDKNPASAVIVPKAKQQDIKKRDTKKEYYTRDELKKFLDSLHEFGSFQSYTFFRLLSFTGMRKGEALALNWSDINFSKKKININKTQSNGDGKLVIQSTKTEASERTIFMDNKTTEILREWHKLQKVELFQLGFNSNSKKQLVFASTINKMHNPNKPRVWMTRITKEYDLKHIPVHGFRHTYATLAIQGGMPPKQLQAQLGHRDIRTTLDIYTSVTKEQKQDTAERFTSFVNF
ncbi:tyrosine-type recombinase/integrase [Liquorilactobacillus hordei]|uniref:tyrosine-type recombinase/integrase n=1 Tax=Liquorilactobacillus hordei TaxID=468911 RepID=UPI0039E8084A